MSCPDVFIVICYPLGDSAHGNANHNHDNCIPKHGRVADRKAQEWDYTNRTPDEQIVVGFVFHFTK